MNAGEYGVEDHSAMRYDAEYNRDARFYLTRQMLKNQNRCSTCTPAVRAGSFASRRDHLPEALTSDTVSDFIRTAMRCTAAFAQSAVDYGGRMSITRHSRASLPQLNS